MHQDMDMEDYNMSRGQQSVGPQKNDKPFQQSDFCLIFQDFLEFPSQLQETFIFSCIKHQLHAFAHQEYLKIDDTLHVLFEA